MSNLMKAFYHEQTSNYITPKGRMSYPSLFEPSLPKGETDQDKARYQVTLLIPKGADLSALLEGVQKTIDDNLNKEKQKTTKVKKPFIKTADQPRFAEYADEYPVMVRLAAKFKPEVLRPDAKPETDDAQVYGGRWARASVNPYWYDHPTGGKGVSLGLQNVQLLDHDDAIGGGHVKASDQFDAVDVAGAEGGQTSTEGLFD